MSVNETFLEFLREQLRGVGPISIRRMFSGAGVYADGVMFALVARDTLYLKADPLTQPEFEAEGMRAFTYETRSGANTIMSYWQAPEHLFDDPDQMSEWARKAVAAAHRAHRKSPMRAKSAKRPAKKKQRR
jgi:DNA transformation protein